MITVSDACLNAQRDITHSLLSIVSATFCNNYVWRMYLHSDRCGLNTLNVYWFKNGNSLEKYKE